MSKITKIWLIVASFLMAAGLITFVGVMMAFNWDFTKLSTMSYQINTHEISDTFQNISIKTNTADIVFNPSEDGKCKVVCHEMEKVTHTVSVEEGSLTIKRVDKRKWYDFVGINFRTPKITVYIPQRDYAALIIKESTGDITIPKAFAFDAVDIDVSTGDVKLMSSVKGLGKINTSTGDVRVESGFCGSLDLQTSTGKITVSNVKCDGDITVVVSTGKVNLKDVTCKNLTSRGSTGDITLKYVIAAEKLSVLRDTGDVKFDQSDAAEIFVETDTGDIKGSLVTDKVFITKTATGSISVPKTVTGGRCELTTDTGDIKITVS